MTVDATDIRDWAKSKGVPVSDRGRVPKEIRDAYNAEHGIEQPTSDTPGSDVPAEAPATKGETPPKTAAKVRRARRTTRTRHTLDGIGSSAWNGLASMFGGANAPLGRTLAYQAPVAGMLIDDILKGSVVDRMLQPIARMEEQGKTAWGLVGPPLIVAVVQANPALMDRSKPMLASALRAYLEVAGPAMDKLRQRDQKVATALGVDPAEVDAQIMLMVEAIFAPPMDAAVNGTAPAVA